MNIIFIYISILNNFIVFTSISNFENDAHGYYQKSPSKNPDTAFLDNNITTETWILNPTIVPFLTQMTVKANRDGCQELRPYYNAAVNHNVLNDMKVSKFLHTCMDKFYRNNEVTVVQLDNLGNNACILIGVDDMVNTYYPFFVFFQITNYIYFDLYRFVQKLMVFLNRCL